MEACETPGEVARAVKQSWCDHEAFPAENRNLSARLTWLKPDRTVREILQA